jgi:hypothetical protein
LKTTFIATGVTILIIGVALVALPSTKQTISYSKTLYISEVPTDCWSIGVVSDNRTGALHYGYRCPNGDILLYDTPGDYQPGTYHTETVATTRTSNETVYPYLNDSGLLVVVAALIIVSGFVVSTKATQSETP